MPFGPIELLVLRYQGDRFTGVPAAKVKALVDAGFIRAARSAEISRNRP